MNDLTDEFLKGKLECGYYQVWEKHTPVGDTGWIVPIYYDGFYWSSECYDVVNIKNKAYWSEGKIKIISKVPTYEEYQALISEKEILDKEADRISENYFYELQKQTNYIDQRYKNEIGNLKSKLAKYKEALQFYAERKHLVTTGKWNEVDWNNMNYLGIGTEPNGGKHKIEIETGVIARKAINQDKGEDKWQILK